MRCLRQKCNRKSLWESVLLGSKSQPGTKSPRRQAMKFPVLITFRNLEPSPTIEMWVQAEAEKLETFYSHILSCHVAVEIPHRHHRKGKQCHVRIDLTRLRKELVINREPNPSSRSRKTRAALAGKASKAEPHHDLRL